MRDLTGIEVRIDKDGRERCRGYIKQDGRLVRGKWTDYSGALAWRYRALADRSEGHTVGPRKGPTVAEESERFLRGAEQGFVFSRKDRPYAPKTIRSYRQAFRDWINPELGHIQVTQLRRSQVQRWVDWLSGQREAGTVRNTWAALAALYSWLLPRNDDLANPTDGVRLPRPGKPRERYADREEMMQLLGVLPSDLARPYALAFYAGLRKSEIQALRWEDVDDFVHVRRALDPVEGWKDLKSDAGLRVVPVFRPLRAFLKDSGRGLVVPSLRSSQWGAQMLGRPFSRKCEAIWEQHELEPIGLHEARHSFCTHLIRAGYDVKLVQEWMGHAQASTTLNVYAKKRGVAEGLAEKMDAYLAT